MMNIGNAAISNIVPTKILIFTRDILSGYEPCKCTLERHMFGSYITLF